MNEDSDENSIPSHLAAAKADIKTAEDASKMQSSVENSKVESKDLCEYSAVFDFAMVSAAFEYYKYQKNNKNVPLNISRSHSTMWDNSYSIIKEVDTTHPSDSATDLEKTLSDSDLISEWPKFNTDFLNLYNFFDEQLESGDPLGNQSTLDKSKNNENEVSVPLVANFEMGPSNIRGYRKHLVEDSSEDAIPETDTESFRTRSAVSKSSSSSSERSENAGEERAALKRFHMGGYYTEELDYEPSEAGETEAKESDNEFCVENSKFSLKEKENGSFSHYRSLVQASENSNFHKGIEEIGATKGHGEICAKQDFIGFFENSFQPGSSKSGLPDNYERYYEYEDDDESESDSEHSFKRNANRNRQVNDLENLQPPVINPDISKVHHLNSISEVMLYICEQCKCGNLDEAIAVANRYIAISIEAVQLEIFKELFINIIDFLKSSVCPVDDVRISKSLGDVMGIFHESKLFSPDLCSLIVIECFGCDRAIKTGKEFLSLLQRMKVPIDGDAISSCIGIMVLPEIPALELISFMEYVKHVCNLPCPKSLLCEVLSRFSRQEGGCFLPGFFRLCKFLCSITSKEVDLNHLRNFIQFCIKNDSWPQISNFFRAWCNTDGHLISCVARSFLFRPEDVGLFYEKLAEEIYKHGDASLYLVSVLGQIGVSLMLEVLSRKLYDSAFDVLFTLHKRNINYFELQASLYNAPSYLKNVPNFTERFVFPFTVAFAALDICLHLERFRDAYHVFKSFSLRLPADMDEKVKLKVRSRRFGYLLKLTKELFSREPLKLGLQAFHDISTTAEDFSLEELQEFAEEIQAIYNKYLTYVVNGCQLHTALELFECSEGLMKEVFVVHPQVLRGLLVTFAQNGKMDEANKFFSLGCAKKVYNMEQTETERFVWCLTVMSSWTVFEVEFVLKSFIKNVCLAWDGQHKAETDQQPSVRIEFKESEEDSLEIDCLKKSHNVDSAREIVCSVLQSLDSSIKWVEKQNPVCLELAFETIYNYSMNKSPNFLWRKNSRKNFLEDVIPNAELNTHLAGEDFAFKYSTESNCVQSLDKVPDELTTEYSVTDTANQLVSNKIRNHSLKPKLPDSCQSVAPETTFLEDSDQQFSDFTVSRSSEKQQIVSDLSDVSISRRNEQEQIVADIFISRSNELEQVVSDISVSRGNGKEQVFCYISPSRSNKKKQAISDFTVSRSNREEQVASDLSVSTINEEEQSISVSRSIEQEQIISSSNQMSPYPHSSSSICPTPDRKVSETEASESIPTDISSEISDQAIPVKNVRKISKKIKVFRSLSQLRSKKSVLKAVKLKKKCQQADSKKTKPVSKKDTILPPETEKSFTITKIFPPGPTKPACSPTKPSRIENFQITLRKSAQDKVSRLVSRASEAKLSELKNIKAALNVPEAVFLRIVLFLRSKVLLKCKDLQPQQQQDKANHLASLFIQSNVVNVMDKKTMKLLSEFADSYI